MLSARELDVEKLADDARTWTNETAGLHPRLRHHRRPGRRGHQPGPARLPGQRHQPRAAAAGRRAAHLLRRGDRHLRRHRHRHRGVRLSARDRDSARPAPRRPWEGTTGVGDRQPVARALFALRFGDLNLLISDQLTDDSQILFRRAIGERVQELAPFLAYDRDPYLVSADGRLLWVRDAYTPTRPLPERAAAADGRAAFAGANYIRNSVKVVVDAYDGTVRFFLTDPDDRSSRPGRASSPTSSSRPAMPEELQAHLRYPEDLFIAQNQLPALPHAATDDGRHTSTTRTTAGRSPRTWSPATASRWSRTT